MSLNESDYSRFATVVEEGKELRIHYNDLGQGEQTVVMLHGSGPGATGWANFHRNVDAFVGAGYRVVLMDLRGYGDSSRPAPDAAHLNHSKREMALDAIAAMPASAIWRRPPRSQRGSA